MSSRTPESSSREVRQSAAIETLMQVSKPGAADTARLRTQARAVLVGLIDVLEGTARPKGRRRLLEVAVDKPAERSDVLDGFLVVPALKQDLLKRAVHAVGLLKSADELARLDRHLQDAKLSAQGNDAGTLRALVDASAHGLELVDGERVQGLGVKAQLDALEKHTAQLATMLKKLSESLERAPTDVLRAVVTDKDEVIEVNAANLTRAERVNTFTQQRRGMLRDGRLSTSVAAESRAAGPI